uniref:Uncharacterized protein n=1 Tax=Chenopodium quinoa TaxID=63459 RepID=A0A803MY34_CHEQI
MKLSAKAISSWPGKYMEKVIGGVYLETLCIPGSNYWSGKCTCIWDCALKYEKRVAQPPTAPSGVGMYGTPTIGQPIGGPLVSAIGTPINLPPPHMPYGVRVPVPGSVVPGAPMGMAPLTYLISHTSAHRGDEGPVPGSKFFLPSGAQRGSGGPDRAADLRPETGARVVQQPPP